MKRIVYHELGVPSQVIRVEDGPSEPLGRSGRMGVVLLHGGQVAPTIREILRQS